MLTIVAICSTVGAFIRVVAAAVADAVASGVGAALATAAAALAVASCAQAEVATKSDVPNAPAPQISTNPAFFRTSLALIWQFTGNEAKLIRSYTALARSGIGMTPVEDLNCLLYRDLLPFTARYHQLALH